MGEYLPIVNYVLKLDGLDIDPGLRSRLLTRLAHEEEGLTFDERRFDRFLNILLYPRSYLDRIGELPAEKHYAYNFVGSLYSKRTYSSRKWIIDFAKSKFTEPSYYCINDPAEDYQAIGKYDVSLEQKGKRFVPRHTSWDERQIYFDAEYFRVLKQSRFTLCPAGDAPWSMRFVEAIMCRSIPILEKPAHAGRNRKERAIGYRYYLIGDNHHYREDWVEENHRRFLACQTLTVGV